MDSVIEWSPLLFRGLLHTLALFFMALVLELAIAFIIGLARLSQIRLIRVAANVYTEVFRGISLFVTLFWLYFALPFFGVQLTAFESAVYGLGLVHGAYASEYVRSGIVAVPKGQYEAATALNMSPFQRMRYIILPQALVVMIPLFGNEFVMLLKATSIASLITVAELTERGHAAVLRTYQPGLFLTIILLTYFALAQAIAQTMRFLETKIGSWKARG